LKFDVRPSGDRWEIKECRNFGRIIDILESRKLGAIKKVRIIFKMRANDSMTNLTTNQSAHVATVHSAIIKAMINLLQRKIDFFRGCPVSVSFVHSLPFAKKHYGSLGLNDVRIPTGMNMNQVSEASLRAALIQRGSSR